MSQAREGVVLTRWRCTALERAATAKNIALVKDQMSAVGERVTVFLLKTRVSSSEMS